MKSFEFGEVNTDNGNETIDQAQIKPKSLKEKAQKVARILGLISAMTIPSGANASQSEVKSDQGKPTVEITHMTMISEFGYLYKYIQPQLNPHNLLGNLAEKDASWNEVFKALFADEIKHGETVSEKTCKSDIEDVLVMAEKNLGKIKYPKVAGMDAEKLHEATRKNLEKEIRDAGNIITKQVLSAIDAVNKEEHN